jgi:hypothetical protein
MYPLIAIGIVIALLAAVFLLVRRAKRPSFLGARRDGPPAGAGYSTEARQETGGPGAEPDFSEFPCPHERSKRPIMVRVRGCDIACPEPPLCAECLTAYLEKYSQTCASCSGPILPGMPVGQAWGGAKHPFTHLMDGCCESGGLYCGRWGQGRLVTLHELNPEKYPPGTVTVMAHAFKTGGMVVENID